jgi:hypothetical protein
MKLPGKRNELIKAITRAIPTIMKMIPIRAKRAFAKYFTSVIRKAKKRSVFVCLIFCLLFS